MRKSQVHIPAVLLAVIAFVCMASPAAATAADSGEFTSAEASADWTQGHVAGSVNWEGGCATSSPCKFEPYVTVGTSECSSEERSWAHSNDQLTLAWSGEQHAAGAVDFDVSEVPLSGSPGQLACLSLLETYEERPDCVPEPGKACPLWIRDVMNSSVIASAALSVPPSIESESASTLTATDATLEARIDPHEADAYYQFQLVSDSGEYASEILCPEPPLPKSVLPCIGTSSSGALSINFIDGEAATVSLDLAGAGITLQPGTTYHYRVLAAKAKPSEDTIEWLGPTVYGADQTFETPEESPSSSLDRQGGNTPNSSPPPAGQSPPAIAPQRRRHHHRHHHHKDRHR